jgi:ribonuclease P protein component
MLKEHRLSKAKDFAALRRNGRSWSDGLLVLVARPNERKAGRVGFVVGKRIGNAVVRNKIKRRLREAVRLGGIEEGWDLILIARKGSSEADYHDLNRSVRALFRRAGFPASPPEGRLTSLKTH